MSLRSNNTDDSRLRRVQRRASDQARRVTSSQTRQMASSRIEGARTWSAPQLDRFGHYIEHEFGPRFGLLCHRTAGRMQPSQEEEGARRGPAILLLMLGGLVGAIGAVARLRGRSRTSGERSRPAPAERLSAVTEPPPGHTNPTP